MNKSMGAGDENNYRTMKKSMQQKLIAPMHTTTKYISHEVNHSQQKEEKII